jgi:hypothetical protein
LSGLLRSVFLDEVAAGGGILLPERFHISIIYTFAAKWNAVLFT